MQIKTTVRYQYLLIRMAKMKTPPPTNAGKDAELEFSYVTDGNAKQYRHSKNYFGGFS